MFLLPESIKNIGMKTTKKSWNFPHYKSVGVFLDIQMQITPYYVVLSGGLLDIMHVLDTYKFKMDWINTKQEKLETSIFQMLKGS